MKKYILNQNELQTLVRYEILYKWKEWQNRTEEKSKYFGTYLLKDTPYQPEHEFIQNFCKTNEERTDPIKYNIYEDILPADLARYQTEKLYQPLLNK